MEGPRASRGKRHLLSGLLCQALCAGMGGVNSVAGMEECRRDHQAWFAQGWELPHGIVTPDAFERALQLLEPQYMQDLCARWVDGQRHCAIPMI